MHLLTPSHLTPPYVELEQKVVGWKGFFFIYIYNCPPVAVVVSISIECVHQCWVNAIRQRRKEKGGGGGGWAAKVSALQEPWRLKPRGTRETPGYKQHELTSSGGPCMLTFIVCQTYGPCQTNANAPKMLVFQRWGGGGCRNLFYSRKLFPCSRCSVRSIEALEKLLEIGIYI